MNTILIQVFIKENLLWKPQKQFVSLLQMELMSKPTNTCLLKKSNNTITIVEVTEVSIVNRPGVAGAVLQTASLLIH